MSISGIDETTPLDTAFVGDGAGQIRDLKAAIKAVFPGVGGAITKPAGYNSTGSTTPTEADFSKLFTDVDSLFGASNSQDIPVGTISAWFGDPTNTAAINAQGWYLCDGGSYNGFTTPNLQNRFIKGWDGTDNRGAVSAGTLSAIATSDAYDAGTALAGTPTPKEVSGSSSYTLTQANIPEHRHLLTRDTISTANDYSPKDNVNSSTTIVSSATAGSGDSEYELAGASLEPNAFLSGPYGNSTTTPITVDTSIDSTNFNHHHKVDLSGTLEPEHFVLAWICYCGVA